MSQRTKGFVVNAFVAVAVIALLHVFFVAVPSRLAARGGSEAPASPAVVAAPAEVAPAEVAPAEATPAGAGAAPVPEVAAEPVHGPSGVAPGILAAPDRN